MDAKLIARILSRMQKEAAVPAAPVDPATGMPMDPTMMGGMPAGAPPPMDPAMMGMPAGAPPPMDPAMMGGMPPVDPATGMPIDPATGMPIDPAMMGMPASAPPPMDPAMMGGMPPADPNAMPVMLAMPDLEAILEKAKAGDTGRLDKIEQQLKSIMDMLQISDNSVAAPAESAPEDIVQEGLTDEAADPNLQKVARWEDNHNKWLKQNEEWRKQTGVLERLRGLNLTHKAGR